MKRAAKGKGGCGGSSKRRYVPAAFSGKDLTRGVRGVLISCEPHLEKKAIRECTALLQDVQAPATPPKAARESELSATPDVDGKRSNRNADAASIAGQGIDGNGWPSLPFASSDLNFITWNTTVHSEQPLVLREATVAVASRLAPPPTV